MTRFRGVVWRHVPPGAEPLHLGWILKAARVLQRLGIHPEVLVGNGASDLTVCRALALRHVLNGEYRAILAPSASLRDAVNLMVYTESTRGIQELSNGPDRVPITPGFRWPGP